MTQTLAIFLDAYRDLNSRKLFWLAMVISALVDRKSTRLNSSH